MSEISQDSKIDEVKTALFQIRQRIVKCLKDSDEYNNGELEMSEVKALLRDIVDILSKNL